MKKNIDTMNAPTLDAYFEMVYQESLQDSEIPYKYELSTKQEWLEWYDKRKLKCKTIPSSTIHDMFKQEDVWLKRKPNPYN